MNRVINRFKVFQKIIASFSDQEPIQRTWKYDNQLYNKFLDYVIFSLSKENEELIENYFSNNEHLTHRYVTTIVNEEFNNSNYKITFFYALGGFFPMFSCMADVSYYWLLPLYFTYYLFIINPQHKKRLELSKAKLMLESREELSTSYSSNSKFEYHKKNGRIFMFPK